MASSKIIARNVAAVRRFTPADAVTRTVVGNPSSTRLESGVGNCFPGLECDLRNLERRFFPFLEVDVVGNFLVLASVDRNGVDRARAAGQVSAANAAIYTQLADDIEARLVLISRLTGTFGILGQQTVTPGLIAMDGQPAVAGSFNDVSEGPQRAPADAWTALRLLTEGTNVTLVFRRQGLPQQNLTLTAARARYLDDNGALSAAFLPGELSQSLCSPWTHDFRDCGCFYWASNHPDIAQPVLPTPTTTGAGWNADVPWQRRDRAIGPNPPQPASENSPRPVELDHYAINNRWQTLHFIVGRHDLAAPFQPGVIQGIPFADRAQTLAHLRYAAAVELAVAQEYLTAAYSLKADNDPSIAGNANRELRDDIRATRAELMRLAIGEMRHLRSVNDVLRGLSPPGTYTPALRVASQVPGAVSGVFRDTQSRAATRAAITDFIAIEAPSAGVDGLYVRLRATLQTPPADLAPQVTDEWREAINSIIAEGEEHYQTFRDIQEWLSNHAETRYLRAVAPPPPPAGNALHQQLQAAYATMLERLHTGYAAGRFLGAQAINTARTSMVQAGGLDSRARAVANAGFLVMFNPPADQRFAPLDPPVLVG